jgi:DNA-binding MarR family transcriptional regulator
MSKSLFPTQSNLMAHMGEAFLTWRRFLQRNLTPYGITLKQQFVLRHLDSVDCLYPSDIAEMLYCDRPTTTVILDNLEKQGWICRERDPQNRKFMRISITPGGREKLAELKTIKTPDFDPFSSFTPDEIQELDRLLNKLNQHLKQIAEPGNFSSED